MKRRLVRETKTPLFLSLEGLAAALDCGRNMADKVGREAGAKVKFGGCVRYNLERVKEYLEKLTEEQEA